MLTWTSAFHALDAVDADFTKFNTCMNQWNPFFNFLSRLYWSHYDGFRFKKNDCYDIKWTIERRVEKKLNAPEKKEFIIIFFWNAKRKCNDLPIPTIISNSFCVLNHFLTFTENYYDYDYFTNLVQNGENKHGVFINM